jgi:hypothetical protein
MLNKILEQNIFPKLLPDYKTQSQKRPGDANVKD